jgi:hypothetical protein
VNPWFTFVVEIAMMERNIAYRVWKRRKPAADRTRYKVLQRQINYLVRKFKRLYMKRFLDPNPPVKKLWRNLDSVGTRETMEYNIIYTPDQLNTFLATPQTVRQQKNLPSSTLLRWKSKMLFIRLGLML